MEDIFAVQANASRLWPCRREPKEEVLRREYIKATDAGRGGNVRKLGWEKTIVWGREPEGAVQQK